MSWRERLFGAGVLSNIGANGVSMLVQVAIQLVSVPILAHAWGLEIYGVWLIALAIPAWLSSGDFGFQGVGANEMTALVAQNRRKEALAIFQALALATAIVIAVLGVLVTLLMAGPFNGLMDFAQDDTQGRAIWLVLAVLVYGLVNIGNGLANAALRATGGYAKYTHAIALTVMAENSSVIVVAMLGGGLVEAAMAYLAMRCAGTIALWLIVAHHARWLLAPRWTSSLGELKRLARPALALAVLPMSFTLSLQTMAPVIAAAGGVALVPVFTAVRTLTRFAVQVTAVVSTGIMPNFTMAVARGDRTRQADLAAITVTASIATLVPALLGLLMLGPWFMNVWTAGAIDPPYALIAALALAMVANGTWIPLSNLMLAVNRHESFTYAFLVLSVLMLGLAYVLVGALGVTGAGIASLVLDAAMLVWVVVLARRHDLLAGASLRGAPGRAVAMIRARLGRV